VFSFFSGTDEHKYGNVLLHWSLCDYSFKTKVLIIIILVVVLHCH